MSSRKRLTFSIAALAAALLVGFTLFARAQTPADQIVNNPDAFAWKVFLDANHPADLTQGRGIPDLTKRIGDEGTVVWQTWKENREIFLAGGVRPPGWNETPLDAPLGTAPVFGGKFRSPRKILLMDEEPHAELKTLAAGEPPPSDVEESRMNRPAFEFVVDNELYNIEGQEAFHAAGRMINLPPEAREAKPAWNLLSPKPINQIPPNELRAFRRRYHTTTLVHEGKTYLYGLAGLHLTTKDLPNWVWMTFEHVDNPSPEQPDNGRAPQPRVLLGTKWENYRLRGTQIDFIDSAGQPTILANTQIEAGFQQTSSCMTCHSRATIGAPLPRPTGAPKRANRLRFFERFLVLHRRTAGDLSDQPIFYGSIGSPDADWFREEDRVLRRYTQLDFMWSLRNAQSKLP